MGCLLVGLIFDMFANLFDRLYPRLVGLRRSLISLRFKYFPSAKGFLFARSINFSVVIRLH